MVAREGGGGQLGAEAGTGGVRVAAHESEEAQQAQQAHEAGRGVGPVGAAVRVAEHPVKGEHGDQVHPEHSDVREYLREEVAPGDDFAVGHPASCPAVPNCHIKVDDYVRHKNQRQDKLDDIVARGVVVAEICSPGCR